jgi:hypothetical protein
MSKDTAFKINVDEKSANNGTQREPAKSLFQTSFVGYLIYNEHVLVV